MSFFPNIAPFVPKMTFGKGFVHDYIQLEKLQSLDRGEMLSFAFKILSEFREYGEKQYCNKAAVNYINRGMNLIGILYGKSLKTQVSQRVKALLSLPWTIGPLHGDFHSANLLKNGDNQPKIIDLDSFLLKGIQALDALNFIIDYEVSFSDNKWFEVLNNLLLNEYRCESISILQQFLEYDLNSLALLYVLNRLGYENSYYHLLSQSVYKEYAFIRNLTNQTKGERLSG